MEISFSLSIGISVSEIPSIPSRSFLISLMILSNDKSSSLPETASVNTGLFLSIFAIKGFSESLGRLFSDSTLV